MNTYDTYWNFGIDQQKECGKDSLLIASEDIFPAFPSRSDGFYKRLACFWLFAARRHLFVVNLLLLPGCRLCFYYLNPVL